MRTPFHPASPRWSRFVLGLAACSILGAPADAQQPTSLRYKRADTLRYTRVDTLMQSSTLALAIVGTVAGDARSDTAGSLAATANDAQRSVIQVASQAVVGIAFDKDAATVWFDSLALSTDESESPSAAKTKEAIGAPYIMRFDDRGPIEIRKVPSFETPVLREAFVFTLLDDMFQRFPDKPMARMAPWTDTLSMGYTANGWVVKVTTAGTYRIIRDSLVDSIPTVVISGHIQLTRETTGEVGGHMAMGKVEGECSERTYYAPSLGTVVLRTRRWDFQGTGGMGSGRGMLVSTMELRK